MTKLISIPVEAGGENKPARSDVELDFGPLRMSSATLSSRKCLTPLARTRLKKLAPESTDNDADDGSANGSHADDWCVGFCNDGVGDAQQQPEE